jgi:hypothetical protein
MRPRFRSICPKDCRCLPENLCWACASNHAHTWNEAVRIHNKEVSKPGKKNRLTAGRGTGIKVDNRKTA